MIVSIIIYSFSSWKVGVYNCLFNYFGAFECDGMVYIQISSRHFSCGVCESKTWFVFLFVYCYWADIHSLIDDGTCVRYNPIFLYRWEYPDVIYWDGHSVEMFFCLLSSCIRIQNSPIKSASSARLFGVIVLFWKWDIGRHKKSKIRVHLTFRRLKIS